MDVQWNGGMSGERQATRDLVEVYAQSLRHQIQYRGSNLACSDEDLWAQVKAQLSEDPRGTHCLGLDPLRTMEESLQEAAPTRRGLLTLQKAFQVLEQAALNLYIAPWREEYKAVKMYSGVFTHLVKPALSLAQIRGLFGLLGYQPSPTRAEQLQLLQPGSNQDLLRLACAFFLARCECRLLLEALGSRVGDVAWQLGLVRERGRGRSLQASLDSARSALPDPAGESDLDLYTDQTLNGDHRHLAGPAEAQPHSLVWGLTNAPGGQRSRPDPQLCVSSLSYHLDSAGGFSSESRAAAGAVPGVLREPSGAAPYARLPTTSYLGRCADCDQFHDLPCPRGRPTDSQSVPEPTLPSSPGGSAALSSLTLSDHGFPSRPISYHHCCDMSRPNPSTLCETCRAFHSPHCSLLWRCQSQHQVRTLGLCSCGHTCLRDPLVLCRSCGAEYCRSCWYKDPLSCVCGQPFDSSSPV